MTAAVVLTGVDHAVALGPLARAELDRRRRACVGPGTGVLAHVTPRRLDRDVEPASADVVVSAAALCATADLASTVAAIDRALAPGGRLCFVDHVGRTGWRGRLQSAADPLWSSMPGGCHVDHDVPGALRRGGFVVTDLERFTMPTTTPVLRPWVSGTAVRRARP